MQYYDSNLGEPPKYFFLRKELILRAGTRGFAIYNLESGDLISINANIGSILVMAEKGCAITEISVTLKINQEKIINILDDIAVQKLGSFYNTKIYIEKHKKGRPYKRNPNEIPTIFKCFIELPGECVLNCPFCGYPTLFACSTCSKISGKPDVLLLKMFLTRLLKLNCMSLVFHGGDPIANLDQVVGIVDYCRQLGYERDISVVTNGSLIDEKVVNILCRYKLGLVIPLSSFGLTERASKLLAVADLVNNNNIPLTITSVITKDDLNVADIGTFAMQMKPQKMTKAMVYDRHHNYISEKNGVNSYKTLLRVNTDGYYHRKWHHPCLWGNLAVSVAGDILPCPYLKKEIMSNLKDDNYLDQVFENGSIQEYWDLPLHKIDKCMDCEFQLGCMDCRALETQLTSDLYGKYTCALKEDERL